MSKTKKEVILHIGFPKTGSTSIQTFLRTNRQKLEKEGILYPNLFDEQSGQISVIAYVASQVNLQFSPFVMGRFKITNDASAKAFREKFKEKFTNDLKASQAKKVILSCELFTTVTNSEKHFQILKTFLNEYFSKIQVVAYIRAQEDLISSRYSQTMKMGSTISLDDFVAKANSNYYARLKPWWKHFGKNNLNIRILDPEFLKNGNLMDDFLATVGGTEISGLRFPDKVNQSIDLDAINFMREFNSHLPYFKDKNQQNPLRGRIIPLLEKYSTDDRKLVLPNKQRMLLRKKYQSSNEKLRKEFFPDREFLFIPRADVKGAFGELTSGKAIEIASYLWKEQQKHINHLQRQIRILKQK